MKRQKDDKVSLMILRGLIILLLLLFVAPDFAVAARTVRVGIFDNLPMAAWDRESGQARGIFPELLEEIARREDWLLEYRPGTFTDCFAWLEEGAVDLVTGVGYSEERDWLYNFSRESVLSNWGQLLTRPGAKIDSFLDLQGKTVAIVPSSIFATGPNGLRELARRLEIEVKFLEVADMSELLPAVIDGRADVALANRFFLDRLAGDYRLKKSPVLVSPIELRFVFSLDADESLRHAVDRHLAALKAEPDSLYYRSLAHWIKEDSVVTLPAWLLPTAFGAAGLLVLLAGFALATRFQVRRKTQELVLRGEELQREITERQRAEIAAQGHMIRYRGLFEGAAVSIWDEDLRGVRRALSALRAEGIADLRAFLAEHPEKILALAGEIQVNDVNEASLRIFRASGKKELIAALSQTFVEESLPVLAEALCALWAGAEGFSAEVAMRALDGTRLTTFISLPIPHDEEAWSQVSVSILDLTDYQETRKTLRQLERRHQTLVEHSPVGIFYADRWGKCSYINRRGLAMLGMVQESALGDGWLAAVHYEDRPRVEEAWRRACEACFPFKEDFRFDRGNGSLAWVMGEAVPERDEAGETIGYIGTLAEITDRIAVEESLRRNEERLQYIAHHDQVTGLPNRVLFHSHLRRAIAEVQRSGRMAAILFLDLDRFKTINDSLGHEIGDQVLREVSARLSACIRKSDLVARFGGDEFVILLEDLRELKDIAHIAEKILRSLPPPIAIPPHVLHVTTSIGIALVPADGEDVDGLMKAADVAMYRAKEQGRNNFQFYTPDMNFRAGELLMLETELRKAIDEDQLVLHYQPQVHMASGALVGMEALVRWRHPEQGMVSPGDFIPLAEDSGLILPIGVWVLRTACAQNRAWQEMGLPPIRVSVNISARQFRQIELVRTVERILAETGLDPAWLELEITESSIMYDIEAVIQILQELNAMGVRLAIDDFGTGYSSLSYLKRLPVSTLKIDQSFVRDITTDHNDAAIATSVIALARSMGLEVIAEGVEAPEQMAFLQQRGCYRGQGYYFSRPLAVEEFTAWYRRAVVKSEELSAVEG